MNHRSLSLFLALCLCLHASPTLGGEPAVPAAETLLGTWTVDLRPKPDAPAYLKKLVITSVVDGKLAGSFYDGSPLQFGKLNRTAKPALYFAFNTDPGEGVYCTSGRMIDHDHLEGMTLSTSRGFLLPWTAVRDAEVGTAH